MGGEAVLTDLIFIEAKCEARMTLILASDYTKAINAIVPAWQGRRRVEEFKKFINSQLHILSRHSNLNFQQALYHPDKSEPYKAAVKLLEANMINKPWFKLKNKVLQRSICIMTLIGHTSEIYSYAFSPNGHRIVSGAADQSLKVWDAESGEEISTLTGHSGWVNSCAFSPDGQRIVSGDWNGLLKVWDAESGCEIYTLTGHFGSVKSCAFSPDGRRIVSGADDNSLKAWDAESGEEISVFFMEGKLASVNLAASGSIAACDNLGRVYILSIVGVLPDIPIITPLLLYSFQTHNWDNNPTAKCEWCGIRFKLPNILISAINSINASNKTSSDPSSTIADHVPETWDDPNLLSECPGCHKPLKFNPFIVDNNGQY